MAAVPTTSPHDPYSYNIQVKHTLSNATPLQPPHGRDSSSTRRSTDDPTPPDHYSYKTQVKHTLSNAAPLQPPHERDSSSTLRTTDDPTPLRCSQAKPLQLQQSVEQTTQPPPLWRAPSRPLTPPPPPAP